MSKPLAFNRPTASLSLAVGILLLPSCAGVRYGLWNLARSSPDYDAVEATRTAKSRGTVPSKEQPRPYWTEYRAGRGIAQDERLALPFGEAGPRELWRRAVGPAYSSMVVAGGLVITMEQRRDEEAVVAFDRETGDLVWERTWKARFYGAMSKEGPRATPAVYRDAVLALGATGKLRCLDLATGEPRWQHDLLADPEEDNLYYGLSASPRVTGDLVLVQGAKHVFAFDIRSGASRWRALDEGLAYATPVLARVLGRETAIISTAVRIVGLDPATGEELWSFPWEVFSGLACTQPLVLDRDRILVSAGYGKGAQLMQLMRKGDEIEASRVWQSSRFKTRFNEPVLHQGYAYGLDEGVFVCLNAETGKRVYKRGRYGFGQLILVGDRILVLDEYGKVHLLNANPEEHQEIESFPALDGGVTLNVPTLAHGLLYLRNEKQLVCYDLRASAER